jgi:hypothetical protein
MPDGTCNEKTSLQAPSFRAEWLTQVVCKGFTPMTIEISMIGSRVGHVSQPDGTNGYAFASVSYHPPPLMGTGWFARPYFRIAVNYCS